jgi:hypothetical protein
MKEQNTNINHEISKNITIEIGKFLLNENNYKIINFVENIKKYNEEMKAIFNENGVSSLQEIKNKIPKDIWDALDQEPLFECPKKIKNYLKDIYLKGIEKGVEIEKEKIENKKNKLFKKGLSMLNSEHSVLKIFNGVNTIVGAKVDYYGNYSHEFKEETFKIIGTDEQTAQELINNYGNEIHKDLLYFFVKATEVGRADFTFDNDNYFNTMGITKHNDNKEAFSKRLQSLAQTEYTAYYTNNGKKTFTKAPIITYSKTGTWVNKKDGTKELYWKNTSIEMKWLKEIMCATRNTASLCLIENDIFTKAVGKNSKNNFIPLYVDLEKLYRINIHKLKENYYSVPMSHILETLVVNESQVTKNGYTMAIKEPLEKFLDDFFEWNYGKTIHENRSDFENDCIIYRPQKYELKLKEYPKPVKEKIRVTKKTKKDKTNK